MCVLVVIAEDLTEGYDADTADRLAWKIGDVVDILEDGQNPGVSIVNNSSFRVVKMPGVPKNDMLMYTTGEYRWNGEQKITIRRRMWNIDLATLEADEKKVLNPEDDITVEKTRWGETATQKPRVTDPLIIGGTTDILVLE